MNLSVREMNPINTQKRDTFNIHFATSMGQTELRGCGMFNLREEKNEHMRTAKPLSIRPSPSPQMDLANEVVGSFDISICGVGHDV